MLVQGRLCHKKLTMPGDSVVIVNAIHVFFPGHTWVRHRLSSNFFGCSSFACFSHTFARTPKSTGFGATETRRKVYFGCGRSPCQTVSFRVVPAAQLSGKTDPRGAKAGAMTGAGCANPAVKRLLRFLPPQD